MVMSLPWCQEALKEKLSQYLSTPLPDPQQKYVPYSEALRMSMLQLMKLHTNLGRSALDYQVSPFSGQEVRLTSEGLPAWRASLNRMEMQYISAFSKGWCLQVIAKKAIEHIKQLEQRLEFANAAQKALAEMYTAQKDLDQ